MIFWRSSIIFNSLECPVYMNDVFWLCLLVATASWILTWFVRHNALARNLLDIPNSRSSHSIPTPHGGGLAIAITFLIALVILAVTGRLSWSLMLSLYGPGMLVAIVGFIDDYRPIAARWRLAVHFISAGWILYIMNGLPPLLLFGMKLDLMWLGYIIAVLYLVWLLNLYNFMDGIDGIAGIEAVTVCMSGIVLYWLNDTIDLSYILPALLLAAVAGFLFWNFPKAKIFMGDVGSGFLGLMLGALSIQAAWVDPNLFWAWLILLGVFIVDATVTLFRRIIRKEKFYQAHCSHAYQHASRQLNSHVRVTISVGLINLLWLLPIAVLVTLQYLEGALGLIIAYTPLIILAFYFKAGAHELQLAGTNSK